MLGMPTPAMDGRAVRRKTGPVGSGCLEVVVTSRLVIARPPSDELSDVGDDVVSDSSVEDASDVLESSVFESSVLEGSFDDLGASVVCDALADVCDAELGLFVGAGGGLFCASTAGATSATRPKRPIEGRMAAKTNVKEGDVRRRVAAGFRGL